MASTFGCPHCGRSNPLDARFCAYCGAELHELERDLLISKKDTEADDESAGGAQSDPKGADAEGTAARTSGRSSPEPPLHADEEDQDERLSKRLPRERRQAAKPPVDAREGVEEPDGPLIPDLPGLIPALDPPPLSDRAPALPRSQPALDPEIQRQIRQIFGEEVPLSSLSPSAQNPAVHGSGLWRRSPIYWLLLGALLMALIAGDETPEMVPHAWPGIAPAFAAIESLPENAVVLIDWAYGPATAGEMDLVARPVIEHLLAQEIRFVIVSQLPMGPATARRLLARSGTDAAPSDLLRRLDLLVTEAGFWPGGAATLPLLGQASALGIPADLQGESAPDLTIVIAARSEAVQRWLEQVQPLNGVPTVAVTSAAADPPVRPYLDSDQLVGLVSGYSGGLAYRDLLLRPRAREELQQYARQISGHNWLLLALIVVVVLGNLLPADRRTP